MSFGDARFICIEIQNKCNVCAKNEKVGSCLGWIIKKMTNNLDEVCYINNYLDKVS